MSEKVLIRLGFERFLVIPVLYFRTYDHSPFLARTHGLQTTKQSSTTTTADDDEITSFFSAGIASSTHLSTTSTIKASTSRKSFLFFSRCWWLLVVAGGRCVSKSVRTQLASLTSCHPVSTHLRGTQLPSTATQQRKKRRDERTNERKRRKQRPLKLELPCPLALEQSQCPLTGTLLSLEFPGSTWVTALSFFLGLLQLRLRVGPFSTRSTRLKSPLGLWIGQTCPTTLEPRVHETCQADLRRPPRLRYPRSRFDSPRARRTVAVVRSRRRGIRQSTAMPSQIPNSFAASAGAGGAHNDWAARGSGRPEATGALDW